MSYIIFEFDPKDIKYLINHNFLKRKSKYVSSLMSYKIFISSSPFKIYTSNNSGLKRPRLNITFTSVLIHFKNLRSQLSFLYELIRHAMQEEKQNKDLELLWDTTNPPNGWNGNLSTNWNKHYSQTLDNKDATSAAEIDGSTS